MQPAERYHTVPHKTACDCLDCVKLRRVQEDAYAKGHQDGYWKGKQAQQKEPWEGAIDYQSGATHPSERQRLRESW